MDFLLKPPSELYPKNWTDKKAHIEDFVNECLTNDIAMSCPNFGGQLIRELCLFGGCGRKRFVFRMI